MSPKNHLGSEWVSQLVTRQGNDWTLVWQKCPWAHEVFAEFAFYIVNSSYGTVLWPRFFCLAFTQQAFEKKNFSQDNSSSFCQKFIISCYGYCWREGGQFSLNPKNPKLSSATVNNTLSKFLHSRTDAEGNQNQDTLRTPDNCFGNF